MNNQPLVSIIMPAFNAEKYIAEAIESIISQTYTNWELLIADDGSADNTQQIISEYEKKESRIKTNHNSENIGYLRTCNKLFKLCKGDYITFQDADDWSDPNRIKKQLNVFLKDASLGICGTWAKYYNLEGAIIKDKITETEHEGISTKILERSQFCGASIMIKREVIDKVGVYKDFFHRIGNEDYDWSMRIVEQFKAANIPEFLYNVRVTTGSVSKRIGSCRKFFSDKIAVFLALERLTYDCDSLNSNSQALLNKYIESLEEPFIKDKSKKFREAAFTNYHSKLYKQSIGYAWLAVKKRPLKLINWKSLIAILLKSITE